MLRRLGTLALMLAATGAAVLPTTAFAQDRYRDSRDNYYHSDRNGDRHQTRQSREQERRPEERRVSERRQADHRFYQFERDQYRPA